MQFSYGLIC